MAQITCTPFPATTPRPCAKSVACSMSTSTASAAYDRGTGRESVEHRSAIGVGLVPCRADWRSPMRTTYEGPVVVGVREQARIVNGLLHERFERLLPRIMREAGFDMWIVVCNEDNHDPVFDTIIPWECWAPILQIVEFHDAGPERGIERLNISLTDMQGLMTPVWSLDAVDTGADKESQRANSQWSTLRTIVEERNPTRIGIDQSDVIWAADGLTATLKERLIDALGPELSARLEPAEPMC